MNSINDPII